MSIDAKVFKAWHGQWHLAMVKRIWRRSLVPNWRTCGRSGAIVSGCVGAVASTVDCPRSRWACKANAITDKFGLWFGLALWMLLPWAMGHCSCTTAAVPVLGDVQLGGPLRPVVARLPVRRLRKQLEDRGLPSSGKKDELVRRLERALLAGKGEGAAEAAAAARAESAAEGEAGAEDGGAAEAVAAEQAESAEESEEGAAGLPDELLRPPAGTASAKRFPVEKLKLGQQLRGIVTGVELAGAYIDVGAEKDGYVHVSQLSDSKAIIADAHQCVSVEQEVTVWVVSRLNTNFRLSMAKSKLRLRSGLDRRLEQLELNRLQQGEWLSGIVSHIADYGAFVIVDETASHGAVEGLVHVSEIADVHVDHPSKALEVAQSVRVRVLRTREGRLSLSLREGPNW